MGTTCLVPSEIAALPYQLYVCDLQADLRAIDITPDASAFSAARVTLVSGNVSIGDNGGGTYVYSASSSAPDNGTTIIAPNVGNGRWLLVTQTLAIDSGIFNLNDSARLTWTVTFNFTLPAQVVAIELQFMAPAGNTTVVYGIPLIDTSSGTKLEQFNIIMDGPCGDTVHSVKWKVFV